MGEEEIWTSENSNVTITLPSGQVVQKESVSAAELKELVAASGVKKFTVELDGEAISPQNFPVTSGNVEIKEYNEAK